MGNSQAIEHTFSCALWKRTSISFVWVASFAQKETRAAFNKTEKINGRSQIFSLTSQIFLAITEGVFDWQKLRQPTG